MLNNQKKLYSVWNAMIQRCTNSNNKDFKHYGGRGIYVSKEWLTFKNFINDMQTLYSNGLSLDRIDNNKEYSKNNCRWVTNEIQRRNTRAIYKDNNSGYRGVGFHKASNKFRARIGVSSKVVHLGCYDTALIAAKAYDTYIISNSLEHTKNFS